MAKLNHFNRLVNDFASDIDFLTVYVQEAHADDGWAITGYDYTINSHRTLEERIEAAKILSANGLKSTLVVDNMDDNAAEKYGAIPESLYIIKDGLVLFQGLGPLAYDPKAAREWIASKLKKN